MSTPARRIDRSRVHLRERMFWAAAATALVLVPVMLIFAATTLFGEMARERSLRQAINESYEARSQIQKVFSLLQDAETGQRGYIITGQPVFLAPYHRAEREIDRQIDELNHLFASEPDQRQRLVELRRASEAKFSEMRRAMRATERGGSGAGAAAVGDGRGRAVMDLIRATVTEMITAEANSLREQLRLGAAQSERTRTVVTLTLLLLGLMILATALMAWRYMSTRNALVARIKADSNLRQAIVDNTMDAILTLNPSGGIATINKAGERMFGYSAHELVGRDVSALVHLEPGDEKIFLQRLEEARRSIGGSHVYAMPGRRKDGSRFPVDAVLGEMAQPDGVHTVAVARDATERRRAEKLKNEFVSTVSHELRTPLTSIAGSLGLLTAGAAGALPDKAARLIAIAQSNCQRLVRLINDILDIEKIQSGAMTFNMADVDLGALAQKAMEDTRAFAEGLAVRFDLRRPEEATLVRGDFDRLTQVAVNLLSNAAKFSPPGGVVEVTVGMADGRPRFSVRDHGPGVPAEFRDRIFSKFAQADSSDTREKGGTGLGLAICKEIIDRHGGRIWFDTRENEGSTFHFELAPADRTATSPAESASPGRVLICEDDAAIAGVLSEILMADGFAVDRTSTLAEAEAALTDSHRYLALLLDLRLPDGHGLDLLRRLRGRDATRTLPVIVVSGEEDDGRGAGLDIVHWMQKPIDPDRLITSLSALSDGATTGRPVVLHVDDDSDVRRLVAETLSEQCEVVSATSLKDARRVLSRVRPDAVILDIHLGDGSGLDLLPRLNGRGGPTAPVVIFSALDVDEQSLTAAVDAVLTKSRTSLEELARMVRRLAAAPNASRRLP